MKQSLHKAYGNLKSLIFGGVRSKVNIKPYPSYFYDVMRTVI